MDEKNWNLELAEYIKVGEPDEVEKAKIWEAAIGLQDVDGLKPSKYLIDIAKEHIESNIDIKEVENKINQYYKVLNKRKTEETENTEEADAGKIRDYNIEKKEWVLKGETVIYASYETIMDSLQYDFEQEKNFSYKDLSLDEAIKHLCRFTSNIWQVHPFCEGNTRTTAVFIIKYLRTFGFDINDNVFAKNSWYFRNSLVRANYKKFDSNIFEDISFLEKFFYNLLTDANYELKNRYIHLDYGQSANKDNQKCKNCTLEEQAIINIIRNNQIIKQEEIASMINKSLRTIKTRMNEMQEKGLIARKNGKRNGEWVIL